MLHANAGEEESEAASAAAPTAPVGSKRPAILADGTYATQAAVVEAPMASLSPSTPNLRALLLGADFFLGGVIAGTLTKLMLRLKQLGALSGKKCLSECRSVGMISVPALIVMLLLY